MKKPETNSSEGKATPGKDDKKKAVSGPVIDSRPVSAGEGAGPATAEPKPPVESKLVGNGDGVAAAPKPRAGKAAAESKPGPKPDPAAVPAAAVSRPAGTQPTEEAATGGPALAAAQGEAGPEAAAAPPAPAGSAGPETRAAETRVAETRVVETRRAGFMPTFLGGVVAAGLGAAVAWWAIPHLPPAWQPGGGDPAPTEAQIAAAREAAIDAARQEIQTQADAFAGRASEAGADAARQALADAGTQQAGDAKALKALEDKLAGLEKTVGELASRPVAAPVVSGEGGQELQEVLGDLTARLAAQQSRIDELAARPAVEPAAAAQVQELAAQAETLQARIAAAADEAEQRIAAAEAQAAELQESAEAANRRARAATAAAALQAALETGGAREQALADLRAAGVEPPAVLAGDLPTLGELRSSFPAAAREALAAALKEARESDGALGAIGNFLRVQTGARSVEPREGSDPDAILSRADAAVNAGDIQGALAEIAGLPQPGQAAMADWTARAQAWVDANAALAALAAGSM